MYTFSEKKAVTVYEKGWGNQKVSPVKILTIKKSSFYMDNMA